MSEQVKLIQEKVYAGLIQYVNLIEAQKAIQALNKFQFGEKPLRLSLVVVCHRDDEETAGALVDAVLETPEAVGTLSDAFAVGAQVLLVGEEHHSPCFVMSVSSGADGCVKLDTSIWAGGGS